MRYGAGAIDPRLERLLGGPDTRWLLDRARRRMGAGEPLTGPVTRTGASPAERSALEALLGRAAGRGRSLSVRLEDVEAVLAGAGLPSLDEAVELLTGAVPVRAEVAAERNARWNALLSPVDQCAAADARWTSWWSTVRDAGPLRRTLGAHPDPATLIGDLAAVLAVLPGSSEPLGAFAHRTCGDPHALDGGPLPDLVLAAAADWLQLPRPQSAGERRELWSQIGVVRDDLSSTVLTLGLVGDASATGRALDAWRTAGLPAVLTLRHLTRDRPRFPELAGRTVFVCENPIVLGAAAQALGPSAPGMVCTSGRPGAAALELLTSLSSDGANLVHHGDFDWGGLAIAGTVIELGATPWRFDAHSFHQARRTHPGRPLRGRPVDSPWDPLLAAALATAGVGIDEEAVLPDLLEDLSRASQNP